VTYPLEASPDSGWIERLKDFFRRDGNRFSYQYTQAADNGSQVVGLVLSFGGRDEARLNAAVGPWLEREAADDEWYVDALAVFKDWGHKGIGTRLLQHAEQQARQHHCSKITLRVAQGNQQALDLYTHRHYVVTQHTLLYGRPYLRMLKTLDDSEQGNQGTERTQ
jgi:ribosomal protein S18 acetylase RimI-like enzyme